MRTAKANGPWPYHADPHGNMVKCANNPCRLHGGGDIMATSLEEAYSIHYERVERAKSAAVDRNPETLRILKRDIGRAVAQGGCLYMAAVDSNGDYAGATLPVIGIHVPDDGRTPVTYEVNESYAPAYADMLKRLHGDGGIGAQVDVESADDMAGMRMFVTPDGLAGTALKNDEHNVDGEGPDYVTAVCRSSECTWAHSASGTVGAAVAAGGRRLDCFDTFLPKIYGRLGFRPVARMEFSREYAPDGWDYDVMGAWNDGCPDVVFMATGVDDAECVRMDDYNLAAQRTHDVVAGTRSDIAEAA